MAKVLMVLTGDERLNSKLEALKGAQAKAIIRKASRTALRPVQAACKRNAPNRTGRLSRSIKIRALKRSRVRVGATVRTSSSENLYAGKQFYGAFQEFGWKTGRRRDSFDATSKRIAAGLRRESRAARKSGKGLAKRGTFFRWRQEKYFLSEGRRLAAQMKRSERKQIRGSQFMKHSAEATRFTALEIYRHEIGQGLERLASGA